MDPVIVVTGISDVVLEPDEGCDPSPFLREKKSKKYLGLQDALATVSAGRALAGSGFGMAPPAERTGLFIAVGYIPFLEKDVQPVLEGSLDANGAFSLPRFAAEGYQRAHPLLAFRCLPNMPAYHIAANFGIEGPYVVCYPSAGQLYLALLEAMAALDERRVDVALVTGVAHQRNYLVEHHMARIDDPPGDAALRDASATVVLERSQDARARGAQVVARIESVSVGYAPFDPRVTSPARVESLAVDGGTAVHDLRELGPASPLALVAAALAGGAQRAVHELRGRDGIVASSSWLRDAQDAEQQ